jgi:hypothetical protein
MLQREQQEFKKMSTGPTQSAIQRVPRVKRQGREADHSLLSIIETSNGGAAPVPPIHFHGV